jgi:hypothetical protein
VRGPGAGEPPAGDPEQGTPTTPSVAAFFNPQREVTRQHDDQKPKTNEEEAYRRRATNLDESIQAARAPRRDTITQALSGAQPHHRRNLLLTVAAIIGTALFAVYLWGGYDLGWKWTGLSDSVHLWDWLQVIALPITVALAPLLIRHRHFLTNRHRAAIAAALIVFAVLVSAGYLVPLPWTGFTGNTLWDWLELTLLPVVVATASLWAGRDGMHRSHPYASAAALTAFAALVLCGYLVPWTWTGFRGNTAWDWIKLLLLPILVPTLLLPALTHRMANRLADPQPPAGPARPD